MSKPSPSARLDGVMQCRNACSRPSFFIGNGVWPEDPKNPTQALPAFQPPFYGLGSLPALSTIQKNTKDVALKDSDLCVAAEFVGSPDRFEHGKGLASLAYSGVDLMYAGTTYYQFAEQVHKFLHIPQGFAI